MSEITSDMVQVHVYRVNASKKIEYLLLQRSPAESLYPGLWQMVTGIKESGESAGEAARREVGEETGVHDMRLTVVPYIASFYLETDDSIHHVPVFAAEFSHDAAIRLSDEHSAMEWLQYDDAWQRLVFPGHREGLRILSEYVLHEEQY
jgi:dihydroneopterin triphosphate diphosphatase